MRRFVCRTCGVVREADEAQLQLDSEIVCVACGTAMAPAAGPPAPPPPRSRGAVVGLTEQWFVTTESGRGGPYSAAQLARMLEQGVVGWTSQVWRAGLKGWRPARRDDLLVFAVASARGMASDTSRLDTLAEIMQADDTFIEDERPARFEAVALPHVAPKTAATSGRALLVQARASLRLGPAGHAWFARYSTPIIAAVAFAAGVLLTQVSYRVTAPARGVPPARDLAGVGSSAASRAPGADDSASIAVAYAPLARATQGSGAVEARALPDDAELRAALAPLTASVHRCARRLAALEVAFTLSGSTGRVEPAEVRADALRPGRLACVVRALSAIQVAPFTEPRLAVRHRFAW